MSSWNSRSAFSIRRASAGSTVSRRAARSTGVSHANAVDSPSPACTASGNAVASVKNLVEHARSRSLREQLDAEREQFTANLQHDNAAEGLRAFFEKCKPRFS